MRARDLMTSDPFGVSPDEPVSRAAEIMRDLGVGCVPVVESPEIPVLLGVITDRDVVVRCTASGHAPTCKVKAHMSVKPLQTVDANADVSEVIRKMEQAQVRRVPVVNDSGVLIGIIAQADLAMKLGPSEPLKVEEVLEAVSAPAVAVA